MGRASRGEEEKARIGRLWRLNPAGCPANSCNTCDRQSPAGLRQGVVSGIALPLHRKRFQGRQCTPPGAWPKATAAPEPRRAPLRGFLKSDGTHSVCPDAACTSNALTAAARGPCSGSRASSSRMVPAPPLARRPTLDAGRWLPAISPPGDMKRLATSDGPGARASTGWPASRLATPKGSGHRRHGPSTAPGRPPASNIGWRACALNPRPANPVCSRPYLCHRSRTQRYRVARRCQEMIEKT
jgi:hypothetical protein